MADNHSIKNDEDNEPIETVTMVDVLKEEQELEEDANAVLGASDDKNCTYIQGYVKRQALYACLTCRQNDSAGICLACSYACHEGHDLIELYTKRNFKCDCGNSRFPSNPCKLFKQKSSTNSQNSYNHNFNGKYCTCSRPYPDPEDNEPDEMIQCIVCEDWLHSRHLNCTLPENEDYGEMICFKCMAEHSFLWKYHISTSLVKIEKCDESGQTSEENKEKLSIDDKSVSKSSEDAVLDVEAAVVKTEESDKCLLDKLSDKTNTGSAFWHDGWRLKLCRCNSCLNLYKSEQIEFLVDQEDTVHAYEEQGKSTQMGSTQYDQGMSALGKMDRVQQIEAIHGYNDMTAALKDYLKKFAENRKVVREEDIKEFFGEMQSKKKQKQNHSIPYFCK